MERTLRGEGIDVSVDLTHEQPGDADQEAEAAATEKLGIRRYRFPMSGDGFGPISHYAHALEVIHDAASRGERVLVHCAAGSQRTGAAMLFYRVLVKGDSVKRARERMVLYERDPADDAKLWDYATRNLGVLAEELVARGVLERLPEPMPDLAAWHEAGGR